MIRRREEWQHEIKHRLKSAARDRLAERGEDYVPPPPPPLGDFGYTYAEDYVERTVEMLWLSKFQCWPEGGGWAQQSALLVNDVMTRLALERYAEWDAQYGVDDAAEFVPDNAPRYTMNQLG